MVVKNHHHLPSPSSPPQKYPGDDEWQWDHLLWSQPNLPSWGSSPGAAHVTLSQSCSMTWWQEVEVVSRDAAQKLDVTLSVKKQAEIQTGEQCVLQKALQSPASPFALIRLPFFLFLWCIWGNWCFQGEADNVVFLPRWSTVNSYPSAAQNMTFWRII